MDDKDLYSGLIRLHVLHHACEEPIFGTGIIEELARHGYRLSPGTLYPLLHSLEKKGYLQSSEENEGRQTRRVYRATAKGHKALAAAKVKVHELFSELLEDEAPKNSMARQSVMTPDLMHELATHLKVTTLAQLRRGASNVKEPKAQALLETSTAVVEGLIKAFDQYEKKRKARS